MRNTSHRTHVCSYDTTLEYPTNSCNLYMKGQKKNRMLLVYHPCVSSFVHSPLPLIAIPCNIWWNRWLLPIWSWAWNYACMYISKENKRERIKHEEWDNEGDEGEGSDREWEEKGRREPTRRRREWFPIVSDALALVWSMLVGVEGVGDVPGQHECDTQGLVTLPGGSWERLEVGAMRRLLCIVHNH